MAAARLILESLEGLLTGDGRWQGVVSLHLTETERVAARGLFSIDEEAFGVEMELLGLLIRVFGLTGVASKEGAPQLISEAEIIAWLSKGLVGEAINPRCGAIILWDLGFIEKMEHNILSM